jgi:hypothetical protein
VVVVVVVVVVVMVVVVVVVVPIIIIGFEVHCNPSNGVPIVHVANRKKSSNTKPRKTPRTKHTNERFVCRSCCCDRVVPVHNKYI